MGRISASGKTLAGRRSIVARAKTTDTLSTRSRHLSSLLLMFPLSCEYSLLKASYHCDLLQPIPRSTTRSCKTWKFVNCGKRLALLFPRQGCSICAAVSSFLGFEMNGTGVLTSRCLWPDLPSAHGHDSRMPWPQAILLQLSDDYYLSYAMPPHSLPV